MEYFWLIVVAVAFYVIGVHNGIMSVLEEEEDYAPTEETIEDKKIMIRIDYDETDGYFFVHEQKTKQFMAHGKTWQEVEERLKLRFPGVKFSIDEDHAKEIGMI